MKYFNRIKNQINFQKLKTHSYFEGWYFKQVQEGYGSTISFIPGVSYSEEDPHAFIQVINNVNNKTYYFRYPLSQFKAESQPFRVVIGNSRFSEKGVDINIKEQGININGYLTFGKFREIEKSTYSPNIMGPFAYVPNMECIHGVISLKHEVNGKINLDGKELNFDKGVGYIEKDYGTSFPERYIWLQSNTALGKENTLFFSYAKIPFSGLSFDGLICVLTLGEKEYRFATYNGSKVIRTFIDEKTIKVMVKRGKYILELDVKREGSKGLKAPIKGKMSEDVFESLDGEIEAKLYKKDELIFEESFFKAGVEMSGEF